jgi:hypothetical protein
MRVRASERHVTDVSESFSFFSSRERNRKQLLHRGQDKCTYREVREVTWEGKKERRKYKEIEWQQQQQQF